jgi:hypothetical protein
MSKKKKIIDIASDVKSGQFVKHSFPEIDAEFSVLRQWAAIIYRLEAVQRYWRMRATKIN